MSFTSGEHSFMDYSKSLFGVAQIMFGSLMAAFVEYWQAQPEALRGVTVGALVLLSSDTLLGLTVAFQRAEFSSKGVRKFFTKAMAYFSVVVASYGMDIVLHTGDFARTLVLLMICVAEASSIFENSQILGFKWPKVLISKFTELQEQLCEGDEPEVSCNTEADEPADNSKGS